LQAHRISVTEDETSGPNFIQPVPDIVCEGDIDLYRHGKKANDPDMVIYEKSDIVNYFKCVWPKLTRKTPPANYHWALGFYFVEKLVDTPNNIRKLDFYVTPTLVQQTTDPTHRPIDFFTNYGNTQYYEPNPTLTCGSTPPAGTSKPRTGSGSGNSYDAGQLSP
jgi:hypothetical protein